MATGSAQVADNHFVHDTHLGAAQPVGRHRRVVEDSDEFLRVFYGPAHIPYLVGMIKLVTDQSLRYLYLFLPVVRAGHVPKTTFADVLRACRRGDLEGALHSLKETHRSSAEILDIALRD